MKSKKIYCVYCGEKNNIKDLKCKKCNKKLNPKENMFFDYLKGKIKDDLKGKTEDTAFDIIKNFIISHLYGSIFTATLIFTIVSAIVTNIDNRDIINVTEKPNILISNLNECVFTSSLRPLELCDEGYILEEGLCKKDIEVNAEENNGCPEGYFFNGTSCVSNMNYEKITDKECLLPDDGAYEVYIAPTGECVANYCNEWLDGQCQSGSGEPIDFTINEYCHDGTVMLGGVCKSITNATLEYSCEEGILKNNNKCLITKEKESYMGCLDGYTYNEVCNLCVLGE